MPFKRSLRSKVRSIETDKSYVFPRNFRSLLSFRTSSIEQSSISSIERPVSVLTLVWSAQPAGLPMAPACTPAAVSDRASHVPASLYVLHTEDFISTSVVNESAQSTLTELEVNWGCCTRKTASNATFVAPLRVLHPLNIVVDEDHHAKDCSVGHCCEGKGVSI